MSKGFTPQIAEYVRGYSSIILVIFDREGIILDANKFVEEIFGRPLKGCAITDFFIDFRKEGIQTSFDFSTTEKKMVNITTHKGLPETYYFRFFQGEDSILALGESNSRETEMLRSSLLELNMALGNTSRELHKKNAELNRLNDQKNEFLGIAAHDLRNPIGIIMGYSSFLMEDLEEVLSDDQMYMFKTICGTSDFMLHLLNNLLDLTAIESGKLNLDLQLTDIIELIRNNVSLNSIIAAKKNIHLQLNYLEQIPIIRLDRSKIEQVMNNLITNAVKFSASGTQIRVSIFMSGEHVTVAVADQGQGIPEAEINNLFKPFHRTSTKPTAGEKSTGLGLSIVRNIILGHHGKIWVESKPGVGTTFYFTLPVKVNGEFAK